ncbi:MAG: histidine decarboxylase [Planctomycetes bacterium]|nr:histidine decarboxylase [Planctomycetota bacterium]
MLLLFEDIAVADDDARRLDDLFHLYQSETDRLLGYPCTATFDYSPLYRFLAFPLNNLGDPSKSNNTRLQTHELEREVLAMFGEFTHAPPDSFWGYVTSGGSEGNQYGTFLARELYPDGIVYHSEDTHYSVKKIIHALRVRSVLIRSLPNGTMDLADFAAKIKLHRDQPPIIFANIGTTMKGAIDDLAGIHAILKQHEVSKFYIHADAALSGMILPFVDDAPAWNFAAPVDSISISGHKMIGCPFPCGVVLARKPNVDRITSQVEYTGSLDTTITGSRNALGPLFLWYALRTIGVAGFRSRIRGCLEVADYACEQLNAIGRNAWRHRHSNTVVFDRPSNEMVRKWQLAVTGNIAHVMTMPQTTRERIDLFVADLKG